MALAGEFDRRTEAEVTPYYRGQVATDRARIAEMDALRAGTEPPPPEPGPGRLDGRLPGSRGCCAG